MTQRSFYVKLKNLHKYTLVIIIQFIEFRIYLTGSAIHKIKCFCTHKNFIPLKTQAQKDTYYFCSNTLETALWLIPSDRLFE